MGTTSVFDALDLLIEEMKDLGNFVCLGSPCSQRGVGPQDTQDEANPMVKMEFELGLLKQTIFGTIYGEVKAGIQHKLFGSTAPFQTSFAQPTLQILQKWSSGPTNPGDGLDNASTQMDIRIMDFKAILRQAGWQAMTTTGVPSVAHPASSTQANPFLWASAASANIMQQQHQVPSAPTISASGPVVVKLSDAMK